MEWMQSLEKTQEARPTIVVQEDVYTYQQNSSIDVHIFCDGTVNKEANRLGIQCIAYNNEGEILTKISKGKNGDSALIAKALSIEEAFHLAFVVDAV